MNKCKGPMANFKSFLQERKYHMHWSLSNCSSIFLSLLHFNYVITTQGTIKVAQKKNGHYFFENVNFCFCKNGILLPKLFWSTVRKNCFSDRYFFFKIQGQEFDKSFWSLEWLIRTVKGKDNFWNRMLFK